MTEEGNLNKSFGFPYLILFRWIPVLLQLSTTLPSFVARHHLNEHGLITFFKQWWSSSAVKEHTLAVWQNAVEDDSHFSAAASNNPGKKTNDLLMCFFRKYIKCFYLFLCFLQEVVLTRES